MKVSRTIIVGLGNPILGDDGIGWRVAEELQGKLNNTDVDVVCSSRGGLYLMESLIGYENAIIIDAFVVQESDIGSVTSFTLETFTEHVTRHSDSTHDTSLTQALKMGRTLGLNLPETIHFVTIASPSTFDFTDKMSVDVTDAIPQACKKVIELLVPERQDKQGELT